MLSELKVKNNVDAISVLRSAISASRGMCWPVTGWICLTDTTCKLSWPSSLIITAACNYRRNMKNCTMNTKRLAAFRLIGGECE